MREGGRTRSAGGGLRRLRSAVCVSSPGWGRAARGAPSEATRMRVAWLTLGRPPPNPLEKRAASRTTRRGRLADNTTTRHQTPPAPGLDNTPGYEKYLV